MNEGTKVMIIKQNDLPIFICDVDEDWKGMFKAQCNMFKTSLDKHAKFRLEYDQELPDKGGVKTIFEDDRMQIFTYNGDVIKLTYNIITYSHTIELCLHSTDYYGEQYKYIKGME